MIILKNSKGDFFTMKNLHYLEDDVAVKVYYDYYWYPSLEEAYQAAPFFPHAMDVVQKIKKTTSIVDAIKISEEHKELKVSNWDKIASDIKVNLMKLKASQNESVREILRGSKGLIISQINSVTPDTGKIWMKIREDILKNDEEIWHKLLG